MPSRELYYYLARKRGLDPEEAREEAERQVRPVEAPAFDEAQPETTVSPVGGPEEWALPDFSPAPPLVQADTGLEDELTEAREEDRRARLRQGVALAGRQLVAGLTQTPVGQGLAAAPSREAVLRRYLERRRGAGEMGAHAPKPVDYLTPAEQASYESMGVQVPKDEAGRTRKDLMPSVTSYAGMGMMHQEKGREFDIAEARRREEMERARARKEAPKSRSASGAPAEDLKQAEKLSLTLGGQPEALKDKLDRLDALVAGVQDVPGIGTFEGRVPDVLTSNEGVAIRNEARSLVNALLKMQSGAGVSDRERAQAYALYGIEGGDERAFRDGLVRLRKDLAAQVRGQQAGFRPGAVGLYRKGGGLSAGDIEKKVNTITIREKKTGKTVTVPASELPEWQREPDWDEYEVVR